MVCGSEARYWDVINDIALHSSYIARRTPVIATNKHNRYKFRF
jgi:hypothetical protein